MSNLQNSPILKTGGDYRFTGQSVIVVGFSSGSYFS